MLLRVTGLLILVGFVFAVIVLALGLRRKPEAIRDVSMASLLTGGGMLCVGFGLAFGSGFGRILLVGSGIAAYLYGAALGLLERAERKRPEA